MAQDKEWKDCGLELSEYRTVRLPRGTETCYEEFRAVHHTLASRRGPKGRRSEQEDREEAMKLYQAKEAKLMNAKCED